MATKLKTILETAGFTPREYSGRGMDGKTCLGVTADLANNVLACVPRGRINTARTDAMGRGVVVYWPDVPWRD